MNFLACSPGLPVVSSTNGTSLCPGYLQNLLLSSFLAMCPGLEAAAARSSGFDEYGVTMATSIYVGCPSSVITTYNLACSLRPLVRVRCMVGIHCSSLVGIPVLLVMTDESVRTTASCLATGPPPRLHVRQWFILSSRTCPQTFPATVLLGQCDVTPAWDLADG